jgi:Flp pilus assembly protein TadD
MTPFGTLYPKIFRLVALAGALCLPAWAWADEFAEVNQLMKSGQFDQALIKADQYLAGKPRDPQMRFLKGMVQNQSGRTADAVATFSQLTQEYPELAEPYNNLAVIYAGQGQFDKARVALEGAVRANPAYATAHENLGDVYVKLAAMSYDKAQQVDPTNTSVAPKAAALRQLPAAAKPR